MTAHTEDARLVDLTGVQRGPWAEYPPIPERGGARQVTVHIPVAFEMNLLSWADIDNYRASVFGKLRAMQQCEELSGIMHTDNVERFTHDMTLTIPWPLVKACRL